MLTPADEEFHIDKSNFLFLLWSTTSASVEGSTRHGGQRRPEAYIVEAVRHIRAVMSGIGARIALQAPTITKLQTLAKPIELLRPCHSNSNSVNPGQINFAARYPATPLKAALYMQLESTVYLLDQVKVVTPNVMLNAVVR